MNHETNNRVLVLGSTGFIGRHLVRRLDRLGYRVDALAHSEADAVRGNIHHIRGSMEDAPLIRELVARCQYIVHVASLTTPSVSALAPGLEISGNLHALVQLLALSGEFPERRFVYLSSAGAVYGDIADVANENASLRPKSYYGAGKVAAEAFIHACTATSTWKAAILRPSNIYGPEQRMRKGFAIIPTLFYHALAGTTFEVWGNGETVRDYCHVDDLVDLMVETIKRDTELPCTICNAASGETASILALLAACERTSARKIAVAFRPARSIDAPYVPLATESARAAYGWTAKTSLDDGLRQTWQSLPAPRAEGPRTTENDRRTDS